MATRRGAGTVFELGSNDDPATATWTAIPQLRNIRVREQSGELEVTNLASSRKQYIQDLPDSAMISAELQYDPDLATQSEATGLQSLFNSGANRAFRLTPNGAAKRQVYVGFVMSNDKSFDPSQVMSMSVEIRTTGAPTYVNVA
jgi:hypothetical protein